METSSIEYTRNEGSPVVADQHLAWCKCGEHTSDHGEECDGCDCPACDYRRELRDEDGVVEAANAWKTAHADAKFWAHVTERWEEANARRETAAKALKATPEGHRVLTDLQIFSL